MVVVLAVGETVEVLVEAEVGIVGVEEVEGAGEVEVVAVVVEKVGDEVVVKVGRD